MKLVISLILYAIIISEVSLQFGLTQTVWQSPETLSEPVGEESGFLAQLEAAINAALIPLRWAFNAIAVVMQFMTYQVEGIPALINTVIISPIGGGILWLAARIVRGGG